MIWFIGQAPSKRSKDNRGWAPGGASNALAKLAGVSYQELTKLAEFRNLLASYPGQNGGGDAFDLKEAEEAAEKLSSEFKGGDEAVFLGKQVMRAFGVFGVNKMTWFEPITLLSSDVTVWLMPHPSGRNRWYNSGENRACASAFVKRILGLTE